MQTVIAGQTITYTTSGQNKPFLLMLPPDTAPLRSALVELRPPDGVHDFMCDESAGAPDRWIDEVDDPESLADRRKLKFVPGVGLVVDGPAEPYEYHGWCCGAATRRHIIDAALMQ